MVGMATGGGGFPGSLGAWMSVLLLVAAASMAVGSFPVAPRDVLRVLWAALGGTDDGLPDNVRAIVLQVRGPRVIAALAVGAALASAGAAYQSLFRNPLVSPDILGVSGGCALGAVVGIFLGWPIAAIQGLAFPGGLPPVPLAPAVAAPLPPPTPSLTLLPTPL